MFYGLIFNEGTVVIAPAASNELEADGRSRIRYYSTNEPASTSSKRVLLVLASSNPAKLGRCLQRLVDAATAGRPATEELTAKSLLAVWGGLAAEGVELTLIAREGS